MKMADYARLAARIAVVALPLATLGCGPDPEKVGDECEDGAPIEDAIFTLRASAQDYQPFPGGLRTALPIASSEATSGDDGWGIETALTDIALIALPTSFKITEALPVIGPGATDPEPVTSAPTLRWGDDASEDFYTVVVYDAYGELVWCLADDEMCAGPSIPGASGGEEVSVEYGGPLDPGMYYQFRVTSWRAPGGEPGPISATEDLRGVFYRRPVGAPARRAGRPAGRSPGGQRGSSASQTGGLPGDNQRNDWSHPSTTERA